MFEQYKQSILLLCLLTAGLWLSACVAQSSGTAGDQAAAAPTAEATAAPTEEAQEEAAATPTPAEADTDTAEAEAPATTADTESEPVMEGMDVVIGRSVLASEVIGFKIRNLEGDRIGQIQDIVVNMADGSILFVTMSYDGGLFQAEKIFPVPAGAFSWDAENEALQLDLAEETLEDAPGFDSDWPDPSDMDYDAEVYAYWLDLFPELPVPAQTDASKLAGAIAKVSDMIGLEVVNPAGENVGEITDIIINADLQQLSTAVLSFGGFQLIGEDDYVIPLAAFELDVSGVDQNNPLGTPVLAISQNNLANAPKFFPDSTDLSDPNWSEPYWSWWERMQREEGDEVTPFALAGTAWQLESFGEVEDELLVIEGTRPTVNFLVERYTGSGGCNWYLGVYTAQADGLLRMQTPAGTRGAVCEPVAIMDQEGTYMSSLLNITEYDMEGDKLVGYTVQDQRLLTFVPAEPVPFETTVWELRYYVGEVQLIPSLPGTAITAQFEGDQLSGSAGCNSYTAIAVRDGSDLTISNLAVTQMACAEPEGIMEQEEQFLAALEAAGGLIQVGGALQLEDVDGSPTLLFGVQ